ncbi:hydantoinase B/oxoprolinase family protein [Exilibacterium tricleocarpae]|uniref:Hydantoinase B/oxoprolinase family protein n=1 Tax=Exilibacterium tricleocarpae TaxID=2591008 RepID=A0A545TNB8_9GAMM|nr:hydantoinase B/oxoprolinase family protein [Exilibacterium tricleocarpae]TQV78722.1 hydantoinase B/oxoprolinase family protein [Exilibacterium tricleocarpae]
MTADSPALDGAQLAVLNNRFEGVARKMANTLLRAGRSGVLNRARDFSACIVTADNQLLAAAESLPIHVLSGPDLMAAAMQKFHPNLQRGDAFLHNSPYHGCSHPADHTILVPVIDDDGVHRFTVVAKAHQADIGNSIPTTYHGTASDVYEEGALIFPAVKVQENYQTNADIVRMCEMRIRVPEQWKGDFLAMIGAARIGEREVLQLGQEVGWSQLDVFVNRWFDYSEQRMVDAISQLPAGKRIATSTHDAIAGTPDEGIVIKAEVEVLADEKRMVVDLRDNIDALPCGLNLSEACARTSALIGVFNSIDHAVPKNAGAFRRVDVRLRNNSVAGIPRHPTSCSAATTNVADRVCASTQTAIAELADGFGMAEVGAGLSPASGVVSGVDPRTGKAFINQLFLGATGGGATAHNDAWLTYLHAGNGGLCFIDSVELDELCQPIRVTSRRLLADTEGAGRLRGASSLEVEFGPVGCEVDVAFVSDGMFNGPKGVRGGEPGGCSRQYKRNKDGTLMDVDQVNVLRLHSGETVVSITTGGGGYGKPSERDKALVRRDVDEGWITPERAKSVYGL